MLDFDLNHVLLLGNTQYLIEQADDSVSTTEHKFFCIGSEIM